MRSAYPERLAGLVEGVFFAGLPGPSKEGRQASMASPAERISRVVVSIRLTMRRRAESLSRHLPPGVRQAAASR